MRREFADELFKIMSKDENVYLIVGDVGYGLFDKLKEQDRKFKDINKIMPDGPKDKHLAVKFYK